MRKFIAEKFRSFLGVKMTCEAMVPSQICEFHCEVDIFYSALERKIVFYFDTSARMTARLFVSHGDCMVYYWYKFKFYKFDCTWQLSLHIFFFQTCNYFKKIHQIVESSYTQICTWIF